MRHFIPISSTASTAGRRARALRGVLTLLALAGLLWTFRSWNLGIGDGLFCCKQVVGEQAYAVTLSRNPLSYLLYRGLFFTLHPLLRWWVEDIIALSSCAAGLVFFHSLYRLARAAAATRLDTWLLVLFPSSTMVLQAFCGHVEFYPWTCALLMVSVTLSWNTIHATRAPFWPSAALALATAFHSSGVFYYPALLLLIPLAGKGREPEVILSRRDLTKAASFFGLFILAALLHRRPLENLFYLTLLVSFFYYLFRFPPALKQELRPWWGVFSPWLLLFLVRASFQMRAEPLLEHLAPIRAGYDPGAFHFEMFSWMHVGVKLFIHFFLAPFGAPWLLIFFFGRRRAVLTHPWLLFLLHASFWALLWSTLFYPQLYLRTWDLLCHPAVPPRDWDLFVSMAIPLNLFAVFAAWKLLRPAFFHKLAAAAIALQFALSLPVMIRNSGWLTGRGYVTIEYAPQPVPARAFLRSLELGISPLRQTHIRAGIADIRLVPLERGYQSWSRDVYLVPGQDYRFAPALQKNHAVIPLPDASHDG
ncbi:MAG: hypothetical protein ACE15F_11375 [bacterium]